MVGYPSDSLVFLFYLYHKQANSYGAV